MLLVGIITFVSPGGSFAITVWISDLRQQPLFRILAYGVLSGRLRETLQGVVVWP